MFPYRISWLRAIGLLLTRIAIAWLLGDTIEKFSPTGYARTIPNFCIWILSAMLMGVWTHLIFVFQGKTKVWKFRQNSIREAVNALRIGFFSDLLTVGVVIILVIIIAVAFPSLLNFNDLNTQLFAGIILLLIGFCSWLIVTPILYQQELNKELGRTTSKKPTKKKSTTVRQKPKSFH